MTEEIINSDGSRNWEANILLDNIKRLEQENKELKKQHYEVLKMLKHEYDGRQRDNEQWFTRCTENHNEDSKIIEKYRSALEEIKNSVINYLPKENYKFAKSFNPEKFELLENILTGINEVLQ